jgi:hypothetical protein
MTAKPHNEGHEIIRAIEHIQKLLTSTPVVIVPRDELARDFGLKPGFEGGILELQDPPFPKRFHFSINDSTLEFRRIETTSK